MTGKIKPLQSMPKITWNRFYKWSILLFGAMSKEINTFVSEIIGDVAQLARALDWQSRGIEGRDFICYSFSIS